MTTNFFSNVDKSAPKSFQKNLQGKFENLPFKKLFANKISHPLGPSVCRAASGKAIGSAKE